MKIEKTFTITASATMMKRIERFLALLHWNSVFGHSAMYALGHDGDGDDKVSVSPAPGHKYEVDLLGDVGADLEIVGDGCYYTGRRDREYKGGWVVKQSCTLYKHGEQVKSYPTSP